MKKLMIVLALGLTCAGNRLHAQWYLDSESMQTFSMKSATERNFSLPASSLLHRFTLGLANGNVVNVHVTGINMLPAVMNLDSIIRTALEDIRFLNDSMADPLKNYTVVKLKVQNALNRFHFMSYPARGTSFAKKGEEISLLKVEQDTLRIIQLLPPAKARFGVLKTQAWQIVVTVNNLKELGKYLDGSLNTSMQKVVAEIQKKSAWMNPKRERGRNIRAHYYPTLNGKDAKPVTYLEFGQGDHLDLGLNVGLQSVRSGFAPSVMLGPIAYRNNGLFENSYGLLWEPLFFFEKNSTGKTVMMRNDFITLRYSSSRYESRVKKEYGFHQVVSLGYLLRRDGDFFEKNTFKFSMPGFYYRKLYIEPQVFFHDLFKQTYPSLRMSVFFND
jgi:hypothetical protein